MRAKYPGICTATGRRYPADTEIERGPNGWQIAGATPQDRKLHEGETRVARGEGYGGSPYREGETFHDKETDSFLTVRVAWSEYYREDGLSFGVGDDSGHVYLAICRPATEAEVAPVRAAIAAREAKRQALAEFQRLFATQDGEYVVTDAFRNAADFHESANARIQLAGEWIKIGRGFTIYGGGEQILVDADGAHIWRVQANGGDGDDWSRSNTSAGIGYRFDATPERLAALAAIR